MNKRRFVIMFGLASLLRGAPSPRDRFIGVWKLIRCERKYPDGRIEYPYGEKPVGRITYDKAGRMSAQLMKPGRPSTVAAGINLATGNASTDEIREAVRGFASYFGTFDVDEPTKTVIHHVEASLVPSWVGTDLKRTYRFSGNQLVLTAASANSVLELLWQREPD